MLSLLCPHWVFDDYTAVTPEFLRERGVRLLLCDLDYTLAPKRQKEPDEPLKAWIGALRASGAEKAENGAASRSRRGSEKFLLRPATDENRGHASVCSRPYGR